MTRTIVKATLRGEDTLVWPWNEKEGPRWMPNHGKAEAEGGSDFADMLLSAFQSGTAMVVGDKRVWVESITVEQEPY